MLYWKLLATSSVPEVTSFKDVQKVMVLFGANGFIRGFYRISFLLLYHQAQLCRQEKRPKLLLTQSDDENNKNFHLNINETKSTKPCSTNPHHYHQERRPLLQMASKASGINMNWWYKVNKSSYYYKKKNRKKKYGDSILLVLLSATGRLNQMLSCCNSGQPGASPWESSSPAAGSAPSSCRPVSLSEISSITKTRFVQLLLVMIMVDINKILVLAVISY